MANEIFNPDEIIADAIKAVGIKNKSLGEAEGDKKTENKEEAAITESVESEFVFDDYEDMQNKLSRYAEYIFWDNDSFSQFSKYIEDVIWNDSVPTVDALELNDKWYIVMNPAFAELCLDTQQEKNTEKAQKYDEDEDLFPEGYFALYAAALLYGAALAIYKSTENQGVLDPAKIVAGMKSTYRNAFSEARRIGGADFAKEFELLKGLLNSDVKLLESLEKVSFKKRLRLIKEESSQEEDKK